MKGVTRVRPSFLNKPRFRLYFIISSILLALWLQGCAPFLQAAAAADAAMVEIETEIGFGASNVKQGKWQLATMTLRNQGLTWLAI